MEGSVFKDDEIDREDFKNIVVPNLCTIATSYSLMPEFCSDQANISDNLKSIPTAEVETTTTKSGMPTAIKVLLWIVGIAVVGFVGVISFFAIKARIRQAREEEE